MDRPEVNPVVTNMPTEGNALGSGGSARIREIKPVELSKTSFEFNVSGVPGHTHNASAMISVVAKYTKTRGILSTIDDSWADEK